MFHLRFTPYDISGYTFDFLNKFEKYIVAREDIDDDGKPLLHYHILIDSSYGVKTIRDAAKEAFKIPAGGKGKNNKYYALFDDWKDPDYICKYDNIIRSKGFTQKEILDYAISGKKKYLEKVKVVELSGEVAPATPPKVPKVPFQQFVIAQATADWYNYKKYMFIETGCHEMVDKTKVVEFVMKAMRDYNKGINPYLVKELAFAVLYDDLDFRESIIRKCVDIFRN